MSASNHEQQWYLAQKARVEGERAGATLVWYDGGTQQYWHQGYYIVWGETQVNGTVDTWAKYCGTGDVQTQIRINDWMNARDKKKS